MVLFCLGSSNFNVFNISSQFQIPEVNYEIRDNSIILTLETQSYEWIVNNQGKSISFTEAEMSSQPGFPDLPYKSILLSIPPDIELQPEINISKFKVIPAPKNFKISDMPSDSIFYEDIIQSKEYCELVLPQIPVEIGEPFWYREYYLIPINFFPIRWNCETSSFEWNEKIELMFDLNTASPEKTKNSSQKSDPHDPVSKGIINYHDIGLWFTEPPVLWGGELRKSWEMRIKIPVNKSGIYQITYEDLEAINYPLANINLDYFHLENQGREISFLFQGDEDDLFEPGETILFYGEEFKGDYLSNLYHHQGDHWPVLKNWQPEFSPVMIEKYTDINIYWLYLSREPGLRIDQRDGTPRNGETITTFREKVLYNPEKVWWTLHFTSEDTWFWGYHDVYTFPSTFEYKINLIDPVIESESNGSLSGQIVSATSNASISPDHHVQFFLNNEMITDAYWDGATKFEFTGDIKQKNLLDGENTFSLVVQSQGLPVSRYGFNHFSIEYQRQLKLNNGKLIFNNHTIGGKDLQISGLTSDDYYLWDISNPLLPTSITNSILEENALTFYDAMIEPKQYIVMESDSIHSVSDDISVYDPVDLLSPNQQADFIMISTSEFIPGIQYLADYRTTQGHIVKIVDVEDIYNQFNFGISHPIAIKNFFGYAYQHWLPPAPKYILLVGDGHWDLKNLRSQHKNHIPPNFVWVDPVQGEVDSLSDLVAVVGDDIFPDAMIGRIPVNDQDELQGIIEKIIYFENSSGDWQNKLTFVADNYYLQNPETYPACIDNNPLTICPTDPAGNFPSIINNLISETLTKPYQINKIFLDEYGCRSSSLANCEHVTSAILDVFQEGNQIITFSGHGAITNWAAEKVLHVNHIAAMPDQDYFPLVFSLDCVDGYWYYPPDLSGLADRRSLSEELIRASGKGAVAVYSSPGNGYLNGHDLLQRGFYLIFDSTSQVTLGMLDIHSKLNLMNHHGNDSLIYTYMIFGDPAIRLHPMQSFVFLPLVAR